VLYDSADKVGYQSFGNVKIGYDAVFERSNGGDSVRSAASHFFGGRTNGQHSPRGLLNRHQRT
jgi:hypothetical protein